MIVADYDPEIDRNRFKSKTPSSSQYIGIKISYFPYSLHINYEFVERCNYILYNCCIPLAAK